MLRSARLLVGGVLVSRMDTSVSAYVGPLVKACARWHNKAATPQQERMKRFLTVSIIGMLQAEF